MVQHGVAHTTHAGAPHGGDRLLQLRQRHDVVPLAWQISTRMSLAQRDAPTALERDGERPHAPLRIGALRRRREPHVGDAGRRHGRGLGRDLRVERRLVAADGRPVKGLQQNGRLGVHGRRGEHHRHARDEQHGHEERGGGAVWRHECEIRHARGGRCCACGRARERLAPAAREGVW